MFKRKYEDDNDSDIEEVYSNVRVKSKDVDDDLLREVFDSGKITREADQEDVEIIEEKINGEADINEEDDYEENDDEVEDDLETGIRKGQGDCPITPFNMKEEMEEGHFDEEGTYHWKKEKVVRDNWLENIDWVKVKNGEDGEHKLVSDDTIDSTESFDCITVYKKILQFLKPKDTIAAALRRLGGNKTLSTAEKWKRKKAGESTNEDPVTLQKVTDLTELANLILNKTGNMDIYQETYENIVEKISNTTDKVVSSTAAALAPELDMYSDDFGDKEKARLEESAAKKQRLNDDLSDNEPTSSSDISSTTSFTNQKSLPIGETVGGCDSAEVDVTDNSNSSP